MTSIEFGADQLRTILHLLGVLVWLGGQIVMLGLLPALRKLGGDAPKQVAAAFGRVSWPAFGLLVVTGIWNMVEIDFGEVSSGYNAVFVIKMLLVIITGLAAGMHQSTDKASVRGITGGIGFAAAVGAFILGVAMGH
jgi:putative copper export protein